MTWSQKRSLSKKREKLGIILSEKGPNAVFTQINISAKLGVIKIPPHILFPYVHTEAVFDTTNIILIQTVKMYLNIKAA